MPGRAVFETAFGFCGVAWDEGGAVLRFRLPSGTASRAEAALARSLPESRPATPPPAVAAVIELARHYFTGVPADFSSVAVDLAGQPPFFAQVYEAVRGVPWGETTSYGRIAAGLGAGPEAARDVGQAMAANPAPLIIPCHRVLAAHGRLGGFSAPGGADTKRRMLALEGATAPDDGPQASFAF